MFAPGHQSPRMLPPTGSVPPTIPRSRRRRGPRQMLAFGALTLVLALVSALAVWLAQPTGPALVTDPFTQAVANLAAAPAVHYDTSLDSGSTKLDVRVTSHAEIVGTISLDGQAASVLAVGGQTYLKLPSSALSGLDLPVPSAVLDNKWLTGAKITSDQTLGPLLSRLIPPAVLAAKLRAALDKTWDYPTTADPGTTVNGIAALKATTPIGDLYVTRNAPARVLRLAPASQLPSLPDLGPGFGLPTVQPSDTTPSPTHPETPGTTTTVPSAGVHTAAFRFDTPRSADTGDTTFPAMSPDDVDNTYNDLESDTNDLAKNSVDADVQFTLNGQAQVNCGEAGCTNTANVTSDVSSTGSNTTITGGQVTAELYATNTIDGEPAGECTNTVPLPLTGTSSISCDNPAAGPLFAAELATKKAQAQAQAEANANGGEANVPYEVDYTAQAFVTATAQVDVQQEIQQEENDKDAADCQVAADDLDSTPNSFVPGTPVLLADGSTEPIERVTPGTEVEAFNPDTGAQVAEPVSAQIVGSGKKDLDQITIADGADAGTLTATANHPFWDPDSRSWINASVLRPGEHLLDQHGGLARIISVLPYARSMTVYNLTVADLHTYYVQAGSAAVAVHNGKKQRFCNLRSGTPKEDWQTKGYHVHMPNDGREVSFYGVPRYNKDGGIDGYDVQVRSTFSNSTNQAATPRDLKLAMAELQSPAFRQDILTQGQAGVQYLQQNFPKSGQIQGLEYLIKAVEEM